MGLNNGLLTIPISIGDISSAINNSSLDLGTLCISDTINKWAKHKPFEPITAAAAYSFDGSAATPDLRSPAKISAAKTVNYGLTIPIFQTAADFHNGWSTEWSYTKPSTYYRMLDFDGYASNVYRDMKWNLSGSSENFLRFPFGGYLGSPSATVENNNVSFPWAINTHGSDGYLLAPSDFAGATSTNSAVNGNRVDLSKMYFGIAAIYKGATTPVTKFDKIYVSTETLNQSSGIGNYTPNLSVDSTGDYYLVPVFADENTNNEWLDLTGTGITNLCSIDGYNLPITVEDVVRDLNLTAGWSDNSSTTTTSVFNFYVRNTLLTAPTITALRCYIVTKDVYEDYTYDSIFEELRSDIRAGQDSMADVKDSSQNIIARYYDLFSLLPNKTPTTGTEQEFQLSIPYKVDGLNNAYTVQTVFLVYLQYTNAGGTPVRELRELYYRNGNIEIH